MWQAITVILITACGMWGGQQNKWVRRFLIPSIASLYAATKKKEKWKSSFYLLLMGILSMGYGGGSKLSKMFGHRDWLVRIVYGLLVAIPFLALGRWWALVLPIAWSIRAGSFDITPTKQFLWEDFIRYKTIGILVVC